jgi:hypothetical protein
MGVRLMALRDRLIKFARRSTRAQLQIARAKLRYRLLARLPKIPHVGKDRTLYVIGLFGTGRSYINELLVHNIGERANYFRDEICFHPGPTSMIYSGHSTMRHVSVLQHRPEVTSLILEAVKSGFADLIFIHRHPFDSLLTNWVWWRTHLRDGRMIKGTSEVYRTTDDLCASLEQNFAEFMAFAAGDPDLFATMPDGRFLSFAEFIEETELHLQSAPLALRLEDFILDPVKEFSKVAEVISVDLGLTSMGIVPPRTKPYGHMAVKEKVACFRNFINELDAETKKRIEKIGYNVDGVS